jgi:Na+-translocating ferredoxin:NAD+ oxidoreductase RnfD subunit
MERYALAIVYGGTHAIGLGKKVYGGKSVH